MTRTVAALYDSRAEAELARARLASEVKAKTARIIAKDTAAAVDTLVISKNDAAIYREGVRNGAHLLVAEVPSGTNAKRVIEVLQQSAGEHADAGASPPWDEVQQGFQVAPEPLREPAARPDEPTSARRPSQQAGSGQFDLAAKTPVRDGLAERQHSPAAPRPVVEEERIPVIEEELRVGKREVARGGARVHSFIRDTPVEEQVSLREEKVDVDYRPSGKPISEEELDAGGLFKERVFEISEMREEPVVTKVAIVREELIVRKTVEQRTETIRDTVRHTEIEVEDLAKLGTPERAAAQRAAAARGRTTERT